MPHISFNCEQTDEQEKEYQGGEPLPGLPSGSGPASSPCDSEEEDEFHPTDKKDYEPDKLNSNHRRLMRLLIQGMSLSNAAEEIGMTVSRASIVKNSELFQHEMERLRQLTDEEFAKEFGRSEASYQQMLSEEIRDSIQTLIEIRDDKTEAGGNRIKAAQDLLSRAGVTRKTEVTEAVHIKMDSPVANMLQEAAEQGDLEMSVVASGQTGDQESEEGS